MTDLSASAAITAVADVRETAEHVADRRNLLQLVQLRWMAVAGQLVTILFTHFVFGIRLPLAEMLALLVGLALFNVVGWWRSRQGGVGDRELFGGLLVDVAVLSGQLFYAGGITNPFVFLFLLQVAVGAVLLRPVYAWAIVGLTCACFLALISWHRSLDLTSASHPTASVQYVGGLLVCFVLDAGLVVLFITRIDRNLRRRDRHLAELRQRAAEEEHIVRMGLLASGAAHELGTPLATLSVIVGDWARMAPFAGEPELREEIEDMQRELQRCKSIVASILVSAGEVRGEAPVQTTLHRFLDGLVDEWRRTRPAGMLAYSREGLPEAPIISDLALRQMIDNVLDNALDASLGLTPPGASIALHVSHDDGDLVLRVRDTGPGFSAEMLAGFGRPYRSTKPRPGAGLGLFLSVNVARSLGGRIAARNRDGGGAEVEIHLPLAALSPRQRESHGRR